MGERGGVGRGGEGWAVRCFVPLMHFSIRKSQDFCPKTSVPGLCRSAKTECPGLLLISSVIYIFPLFYNALN